MPLLLAPHDQTLGAFFQGLYQNCLGNLKTNNGLKIFRVEVRCVAAAAPGCTIVIVRPTPGQKENLVEFSCVRGGALHATSPTCSAGESVFHSSMLTLK